MIGVPYITIVSLILCAHVTSTKMASPSHCILFDTPNAADYPECYIANRYQSMANMWDSGILFASPHAKETTTISSMDGWSRAVFHEMNEIDICRMCAVTSVARSRKLCLMCKKASMRDTYSKGKHHVTFSQSNIEVEKGLKYFACYFDVSDTLVRWEPVKSKSDCISNATTGPRRICDKTSKYIISDTQVVNRTIAIRAEVKENDMCRICMISTSEKYITMGRACINPNPIPPEKRTRILTMYMVSVSVTSLGILGIFVPKLLFSMADIHNLFKKILTVGIMLLQLTVLGILYVITDCEVVHVIVPDSGNPDTVHPHHALLTGLKLCFNANLLRNAERDIILKR